MNDVIVNPTGESLASLSGQGDLRLEGGTIDALTFKDARARFGLASSRFEIADLSLLSDYGRIAGRTEVDFAATPFTYHVEMRGDGIDINRMVGSPGGLGAGAVQVTADGAGALSKDLRARGAVTLAPGTLPAIPALRGIDRVLSKSVLVERTYKATPVSFTLANDTLTLTPFTIESELARLSADGSAGLRGSLNFDVALATPVEGIRIDGVASKVLATLADSSGWVAIPLHLSGTLEDPRVRPDGRALVAQAKQGIEREARDRATEAVGRAKQRATDALRKSLLGRPR
jgi:hypothetical protein